MKISVNLEVKIPKVTRAFQAEVALAVEIEKEKKMHLT